MSYRVRDEEGNVLPRRDCQLSESELPSTGHGVNWPGDSGARRDCRGDTIYRSPTSGGSSEFSSEKVIKGKSLKVNMGMKRSVDMAIVQMKPGVELETDSCGRYYYAKAFMYREVDTKQNGHYTEQILGYGVARRQHGDPKDVYVGEGLAISRALEDLGYKLGKRSWGKVKHNDDIKVMRKEQKQRRRDKALEDKTRYELFKESMERRLRLT